MPTDIIYDFGVIDRLEQGASFSEFSDEQISMYISFKEKQVRDSALLEERLKTQRETQEKMKAEAEYYRTYAKSLVSQIGGTENE